MKLIARLGVALVAVLAVGAVMAGAASAKPQGLKLGDGTETTAEVGETAYGEVVVGSCVLASEGALKSNEKKKDEATYSTTVAAECEEGSGESISGSLSEVKLSSTGEASFKAAVTYTLPNKCAYTFKKFGFTFNTDEEAATFGEGEITASKAKGDEKTCEKKVKLKFRAVALESSGGPYSTSLT